MHPTKTLEISTDVHKQQRDVEVTTTHKCAQVWGLALSQAVVMAAGDAVALVEEQILVGCGCTDESQKISSLIIHLHTKTNLYVRAST